MFRLYSVQFHPQILIRSSSLLLFLILVIAPISQAQVPTPNFDLNNDGRVDYLDLYILQEHWHETAPVTPTPVPSDRFTVDLPGLPEDATPLEMILIPAGTFAMGASDEWALADEQPVHTVTLTKDYYLARYEVTQAQWQAVMGSNPASGSGEGNNYPVYNVSWEDCQSFVIELNKAGQGTFRLPTEAEWEYACRAGTNTRFSFGDSDCVLGDCQPCELSQYAWWCANSTSSGRREVGQLTPNPFGLFDMHGNVYEWCWDWFGPYPDGPVTDPSGPLTGTTRIMRGGAFGSARSCRSTYRNDIPPDRGYESFGLRLLREVGSQTATPSPTPTQTLTPTPSPTPIKGLDEMIIEIPNLPADATPLTMVLIPAGSFEMGSDDPGWSVDVEKPVHTVNIDYRFYLGKYMVTQAQWTALMGTNPSDFIGDNKPVEQISWFDCKAFIDELNKLGYGTFRLPSEAEYEYACRAGSTTRFYFGDSDCTNSSCDGCELDKYGWYCGNIGSPESTREVGLLIGNAFGLYDMHGNLWQWCEDDWHESYGETGRPDNGNPWVDDPRGYRRVLRGGLFRLSPWFSRSSKREQKVANGSPSWVGLRVAMDLDQQSTPTPTFTPTNTPTPTVTPTPEPPETITVVLPNLASDAQPLEMVLIPKSSFQMGSDDPGWSSTDEQPVHTVHIGYDFYMGKYEVTQAQWTALMGSNPSSFSGADKPVEWVSWNDCQGFIMALNNLSRGTFRLPSEAEWEYACRAGNTTRFYFGDSNCSPTSCSSCDLANYAWYCGNNGSSGTPQYGTKDVGQLIPNAFGLHDMHGNVWEWCQDYWHDNYQGAPANGSAWESPASSYRVLRGGDWDYGPRYGRSSDRGGNVRSASSDDDDGFGFRLVRDR